MNDRAAAGIVTWELPPAMSSEVWPAPYARVLASLSGRSTPPDTKGLEYEQSQCAMDTRIYVSRSLTTGSLSVRHEVFDGRKLGVLRFANRYSRSFANEWFGGDGGKDRTAPHCQEHSFRPTSASNSSPCA